MMMAPAPFRGMKWTLWRSSTVGRRKARVFPDPVFAAPSRSLPASSGGIDRAWIGVAFVNPMSFSARLVLSERGKSSKSSDAKKLSFFDAGSADAGFIFLLLFDSPPSSEGEDVDDGDAEEDDAFLFFFPSPLDAFVATVGGRCGGTLSSPLESESEDDDDEEEELELEDGISFWGGGSTIKAMKRG